jgi:hypothetical protein
MSISTDKLDHVNIKILARETGVDLEPAIPMFHRWIQDSLVDGLVIDVADYRHVPAGPGVMLIGHQSNYSLDLAFTRLGLLYNQKLPVRGTLNEKLQSAFASALAACSLVEEEPAFRNKLSFDAGQCEITFNDRLLAPNTDETWHAVQSEIVRFLDDLYGKGAYQAERAGEPRERLRVAVQAAEFVPVFGLLERSASLPKG